jgi:single-strand DNA-binding protein
MNTFTITANLTKAPIVRTTKNGKSIAHFDVAENYIDHLTGERKAQFLHITAFGKNAVTIQKYCHKGSRLAITGTLRDVSYEKGGKKVVRWEVYLSQFTFCDKVKKAAVPSEQETA